MKLNIFGLFVSNISDILKSFNIESYRAKQIAEWMYKKNITNFSEMTNLSMEIREMLEKNLTIDKISLKDTLVSKDCKTSKFLLEYKDDIAVETVLMRQVYGNSVCVSTQAGCNMGCVFCASTLNGMVRNLTAGEIFAQVLYINNLLIQSNEKVNNIVIMGSGEPLANYNNVISFIRLCHESYSLNLSYRNITISTAGIVPMIKELIKEQLPITLSISLHAPNNIIRSRIMPINDKYDIMSVIAAGKEYGNKTSRRVTYEYILIDNINDSAENALELASLLKGQLANVNLIPINPVLERGLNRPSHKKIKEFEKILLSKNINVTLRKEMGKDIQAACGQLRNKHIKAY